MPFNREKYSRQLLLPGFGERAQEAIHNSRVLVIGAGGLGCPALIYLCAAGVGHIGVVDFDRVELSNLHRQILFNEQDTGRNKAALAAEKLNAAYPDSNIVAYPVKLDEQNAKDILKDYQLVIDGTDNFATRYLLDKHCKDLNIPWVYASLSQFETQICVWNYTAANHKPVYYSDVFPVSPATGVIENCAVAGVVGALAGLTACLQVIEAIKIITGTGLVKTDLTTLHAWQNLYHSMSLHTTPEAEEDLNSMRQELMQHDEFLLSWMLKRKNLVTAIGNLKAAQNLEPLQTEYWNQKAEHLLNMANTLDLPQDIVNQLLNTIHEWAIDEQSKKLK